VKGKKFPDQWIRIDKVSEDNLVFQNYCEPYGLGPYAPKEAFETEKYVGNAMKTAKAELIGELKKDLPQIVGKIVDRKWDGIELDVNVDTLANDPKFVEAVGKVFDAKYQKDIAPKFEEINETLKSHDAELFKHKLVVRLDNPIPKDENQREYFGKGLLKVIGDENASLIRFSDNSSDSEQIQSDPVWRFKCHCAGRNRETSTNYRLNFPILSTRQLVLQFKKDFIP